MKRIYAVGVLAALAVALVCLVPRGGSLTGSWETALDLSGATVFMRYTFQDDGTYTCAVASTQADLAGGARLQGNYRTRGTRLYMSEGLSYKIDLGVYDLYRLEGDTLTLLKNSAADMTGFYPLTLTRAAEE